MELVAGAISQNRATGKHIRGSYSQVNTKFPDFTLTTFKFLDFSVFSRLVTTQYIRYQ